MSSLLKRIGGIAVISIAGIGMCVEQILVGGVGGFFISLGSLVVALGIAFCGLGLYLSGK